MSAILCLVSWVSRQTSTLSSEHVSMSRLCYIACGLSTHVFVGYACCPSIAVCAACHELLCQGPHIALSMSPAAILSHLCTAVLLISACQFCHWLQVLQQDVSAGALAGTQARVPTVGSSGGGTTLATIIKQGNSSSSSRGRRSTVGSHSSSTRR